MQRRQGNSINRYKSCYGQHAYKTSLKFRTNKMLRKKAKVAISKPNVRIVCIAQMAHKDGGTTTVVLMRANILFYS